MRTSQSRLKAYSGDFPNKRLELELKENHNQFQLQISEQHAVHTRELAEQSVLQPGKQCSPQQQTAQVAPSSLLDQTRKLHELEGAPVVPWPDGDKLILRTLSLVKKGEVIRGMEVIEEIETFHEKRAAGKNRKVFAE